MLKAMQLIHVIPISRGITKDRLSYFSKKDIPKGAIVSVPIRNKLTPAIVESTEDVKDVKTKLRQSPFPIKKIDEVKKMDEIEPLTIDNVNEIHTRTSGGLLGSEKPVTLFFSTT